MEVIDLLIKPDNNEPGAAEVLLQGKVDGRPRQFLLDTGAAHSSLRLDSQTSKFKALGSAESSGVFAANNYDIVEVESLELGPIVYRDLRLHRQQAGTPHGRNLIGMDLLRDHRCLFLFDEHRLILDPPNSMVSSLDFEPLELDDRAHPFIHVHFGATSSHATWDSGAGVTVVDTAFIEEKSSHFVEDSPSHGTDSTGTTRPTPMYLMTQATVGELQLSPHRVAAVDLSRINTQTDQPLDMIFGYTSLRQANWYFDFPGRRWAISKRL